MRAYLLMGLVIVSMVLAGCVEEQAEFITRDDIKELCGPDFELLKPDYSCDAPMPCEDKVVNVKAYGVGMNTIQTYPDGQIYSANISLYDYKDEAVSREEFYELISPKGSLGLELSDPENARILKDRLESIEPDATLPIKIYVKNALIEGHTQRSLFIGETTANCWRTVILIAYSEDIEFKKP